MTPRSPEPLSRSVTTDLRVVAEGVETVEQLAFLRDNGCDVMQGFLYSEPVSADDFLALMCGRLPAPQAPR